MTRRVDRGRSILGTELEEPKLIAQGREGTEYVENMTHGLPWRLKESEGGLLYYKRNPSTCELATKMEGFCLYFVRLSHTQPEVVARRPNGLRYSRDLI